ncbi:GGDEF domain-containing protein [Marinibactrum halimedae]|nr:GGDEF domain-containing protein [Marinibactrum halimedae]MCD9460376.1 GGDEF domain-containing protein [Marinibactrum halimedae]
MTHIVEVASKLESPSQSLSFVSHLVWLLWTTALVGMMVMISHAIEFDTLDVTVIWPAGAATLWLFIRYGPVSIVPSFLGMELYHLFFMGGYELSFPFLTLANVIAVIMAGHVYLRYGGSRYNISDMRSIMLLVFVAAIIQSVLASLLGNIVLSFFHDLPFSTSQKLFFRWINADITGIILCCPALISATSFQSWSPARSDYWPPFLVMLGVVLVMGGMVFSGFAQSLSQFPVVLLSMPACIWLALRRNTAAVMVCLMGVITACLFLTVLSLDTFSEAEFIALQSYGAIIMTSCLLLHAIRTDRDNAIMALAQQKQHLEYTVQERTKELQQQIAETQKLAEELEQQAKTDYLTRLPNRRAFTEFAHKELQRSARYHEPLSLLLMDVDYFKRINDQFGHSVGDGALIALSKLLGDRIRENIDVLSRVGGEEFSVLLPNTDQPSAAEMAERLRQSVEQLEFEHEGHRIVLTVSIGIACTKQADNFEKLVGLADKAMYRAKFNGRNRVECAGESV